MIVCIDERRDTTYLDVFEFDEDNMLIAHMQNCFHHLFEVTYSVSKNYMRLRNPDELRGWIKSQPTKTIIFDDEP